MKCDITFNLTEREFYPSPSKFLIFPIMTKVYNEEFVEALREIVQRVPFFNSPHDRVRIVEWVRRLAGIPDDTIDNAKNRNDYIQLLKIMVRGGRLHGIFHNSQFPAEIPPLGEAMANVFSDQIPELPRAGPLEPVISRKTPDGCAYLAIRKIPDKGILCYMAVSPDGMNSSDAGSEKTRDTDLGESRC